MICRAARYSRLQFVHSGPRSRPHQIRLPRAARLRGRRSQVVAEPRGMCVAGRKSGCERNEVQTRHCAVRFSSKGTSRGYPWLGNSGASMRTVGLMSLLCCVLAPNDWNRVVAQDAKAVRHNWSEITYPRLSAPESARPFPALSFATARTKDYNSSSSTSLMSATRSRKSCQTLTRSKFDSMHRGARPLRRSLRAAGAKVPLGWSNTRTN